MIPTQNSLPPASRPQSRPAARPSGASLQRVLDTNAAKRMSETKSSRILIVDDEELNVRIVRKYLTDAGYTNFVTTSDSTDAIELIRSERPELALCEVDYTVCPVDQHEARRQQAICHPGDCTQHDDWKRRLPLAGTRVVSVQAGQ